MPFCALTLWFHSRVLLLSWEIKTFLFSLQMSVLGAARCAGGEEEKEEALRRNSIAGQEDRQHQLLSCRSSQPHFSPLTPLHWPKECGGKREEQITNPNAKASLFSLKGPKKRCTVGVHVAILQISMCEHGVVIFFCLILASPRVPHVIQPMTSAYILVFLDSQEKNTINSSGTLWETTGQDGGSVV